MKGSCLLKTGRVMNWHKTTLTNREYSLVRWIRTSKRRSLTSVSNREFPPQYISFHAKRQHIPGLSEAEMTLDCIFDHANAMQMGTSLAILIPPGILQSGHVLQRVYFCTNNLLIYAASMPKSPISILHIFEDNPSMRCHEHTWKS